LWDFWFGCKMKEMDTCHGVSRLRKHSSFVHVLVAAHNGPTLEWVIRYKVVIGMAQGLQYLHEICHRHIIRGCQGFQHFARSWLWTSGRA
jgi:hypothetical protein